MGCRKLGVKEQWKTGATRHWRSVVVVVVLTGAVERPDPAESPTVLSVIKRFFCLVSSCLALQVGSLGLF